MNIKNIFIAIGIIIILGAVGFLIYEHFYGDEKEIIIYENGTEKVIRENMSEKELKELYDEISRLKEAIQNLTNQTNQTNETHPYGVSYDEEDDLIVVRGWIEEENQTDNGSSLMNVSI